MNAKKNALLVAIGLVMACTAVTGASAETRFDQTHPRREEVNDRLHNQDLRIHQERRDGELSARQAARLHRADYRVRLQERRFARHHGGHISRAEQFRLNREENRISRHIGA
jgi:hypothetical protein